VEAAIAPALSTVGFGENQGGMLGIERFGHRPQPRGSNQACGLTVGQCGEEGRMELLDG
jgi:hypothetical protein